MNEQPSFTPSTAPTTTPPPEVEQPSSIHVERSGIHPIVTALLALLLALETLALGYVITQNVRLEKLESKAIEQHQEQVENGPTIPPFVYIKDGTQVVVVNRQTGREAVIYDAGSSKALALVAVPQIGFDGRIFISIHGEGTDDPHLNLYELNLKTNQEPTLVSWNDQLPFAGTSATAISPDQTKLASVYYNPDEGETSREVVIWELLTGEKYVVGTIAEDEYFSMYVGGDAFAGASGYGIRWKDNECTLVSIYEDAMSGASTLKNFKEEREFCYSEDTHDAE